MRTGARGTSLDEQLRSVRRLAPGTTSTRISLKRQTRRAVPYLFLLPALTWYIVFLVYPMAYSAAISLTDWDGLSPTWRYIGLSNYHHIFFKDPISRLAFRNNVLWTVATLLFPTIVGLLLAVALNQGVPGRIGFRAVFYSPAVLPLVAVGMIWAWLYNPHFGLINEALRVVGLGKLARGWLSDFATALPAVFVTSFWHGTGSSMVLYLAALQGIPAEQYDAARVDGANSLQCFRYVTLPWLRETHVIVICLAVIGSFKAFDLVTTMTYGGPGRSTQVLASWMYFQAFQYYHAGLGSAIAWIIAAITMTVVVPYIRVMSRR
ncbi:MAG: sugar ABC transporter permease [Anaerolineae bacterium]|nr:sugar ABC transporter permease [Anaerolineae bacterium]